MGFVGNYAPCGLSPQMYDMPVIPEKKGQRPLGLYPFLVVVGLCLYKYISLRTCYLTSLKPIIGIGSATPSFSS